MGVTSLAGSTPVPGIEVLRELHISDLAVIEDLVLEFDAGLNVFTGQTGAGKSLIIGAFESLLGLKSGTQLIRPGAGEARITGLFDLTDPQLASEINENWDINVQHDDQILITRKLFDTGRSSLAVNGRPATTSMVRELGQRLVDIHGQHDHQFLLKPANQLLILDACARAFDLRICFQKQLALYRACIEQKQTLLAGRTLRKQQLELFEFQAAEIDDALPKTGEFAELQARHDVLANLERIRRELGQVHAALYESDGSVVERLEVMCHVLRDLEEIDPALNSICTQLQEATLNLRETVYELAGYNNRLDVDPNERIEVEQRLNQLNRIIQKYGDGRQGDDPVIPVLAARQQLELEIKRLKTESRDLDHIDGQINTLQRDLIRLGRQLTDSRKEAAGRLLPLIEKQLKELGMEEARFNLHFHTTDDLDKATTGGLDTVEMLVRTNPGQECLPLRKIASGGEMSRVMLALKSVLADNDRISVLVFDEIDANIGGRLGSVIGRKLRELTRANHHTRQCTRENNRDNARHQILCITHLPQIAAFADRHFRVEKNYRGKGTARQTITTVSTLDGRERIAELAEMMAGKHTTETTFKQASELLAAAAVP